MHARVNSRLDALIYFMSRRAASVLLVLFPAFTLASSSVHCCGVSRVRRRYAHIYFPVALSSRNWRAKENTADWPQLSFSCTVCSDSYGTCRWNRQSLYEIKHVILPTIRNESRFAREKCVARVSAFPLLLFRDFDIFLLLLILATVYLATVYIRMIN